MDIKEYHQHPAIGSSGMKLLLKTPAHYWAAYLDPKRKPQEQTTTAQRIGTAWHAAMFEPALFASQYVAVPEGIDKRSKEGKALFAEVEALGQEPMRHDEYTQIVDMANAAALHPEVNHIFNQPGAMAEQSFFVALGSCQVKIRPDYFIPPCPAFPFGLCVDGKTTVDASPEGFGKAVWNLDYLLQAALYVDVLQEYYNLDTAPEWAWIAQEKTEPYLTAVYHPTEAQLEYGRERYLSALEIYRNCLITDYWPGYGTESSELILPAWAQKQIDSTSEEFEIFFMEQNDE